MHGTEEARKIWVGGSVNFRILTLVRRTHALIIGNSQSNRRFTKRQVPRGGVYGVWLSLRILDSWRICSLLVRGTLTFRSFRRLPIQAETGRTSDVYNGQLVH